MVNSYDTVPHIIEETEVYSWVTQQNFTNHNNYIAPSDRVHVKHILSKNTEE
jgi:hypothetical protein